MKSPLNTGRTKHPQVNAVLSESCMKTAGPWLREATGTQQRASWPQKNPVRLTGTLQSFCSNTIQQSVLTATEIPFCWQRNMSLAMQLASFCFLDTGRGSQTLEPNLHTPPPLPNTQASRATAKDKPRLHQVSIWPQAG